MKTLTLLLSLLATPTFAAPFSPVGNWINLPDTCINVAQEGQAPSYQKDGVVFNADGTMATIDVKYSDSTCTGTPTIVVDDTQTGKYEIVTTAGNIITLKITMIKPAPGDGEPVSAIAALTSTDGNTATLVPISAKILHAGAEADATPDEMKDNFGSITITRI